MKYKIFRLGDLYLSYVSIDNCDNEINVHFTSIRNDAKRFTLDNVLIYDNILKSVFHLEFELEEIEVKEK